MTSNTDEDAGKTESHNTADGNPKCTASPENSLAIKNK